MFLRGLRSTRIGKSSLISANNTTSVLSVDLVALTVSVATLLLTPRRSRITFDVCAHLLESLEVALLGLLGDVGVVDRSLESADDVSLVLLRRHVVVEVVVGRVVERLV